MNDSHSSLIYALVAAFVGIPAVFYKVTDNVIPYEDLDVACASDVISISNDGGRNVGESQRRYEKITLTVPGVGEAVLHGNIPGYAAAASTINTNPNYCILFDARGLTRTVYEVYDDEVTTLEYHAVAKYRLRNLNSILLLGIVMLFGVVPYYLLKHYKLKRLRN